MTRVRSGSKPTGIELVEVVENVLQKCNLPKKTGIDILQIDEPVSLPAPVPDRTIHEATGTYSPGIVKRSVLSQNAGTEEVMAVCSNV